MFRRVLVLGTALVLSLGLLAAPVAAFHDPYRPCASFGNHSVFGNLNNPGGAANVTGISSWIDISANDNASSFFGTCSVDEGMVQAFIKLLPKGATNPAAGIALGVTRCSDNTMYDANTDICQLPVASRPAPRFFVAVGGCGSWTTSSRLNTISAPNPGYGAHELRIRKSASTNYYQFLVDGVQYGNISLSDSAISCWINNNKGGSVAGGGAHDGDIVGSSTAKTAFDTIQLRPQGGSFTVTVPTGCFTTGQPVNHPFACWVGGASMDIWNTWN